METGLSQKSLRAIADVIYSNAHVQEAKIFGSRAIGTYREGSDRTIAIGLRALAPSSQTLAASFALATPVAFAKHFALATSFALATPVAFV